MQKYILDYALKHGVCDVAHLRAQVQSVRPITPETSPVEGGAAKKWELVVSYTSGDNVSHEVTHTFDQVGLRTPGGHDCVDLTQSVNWGSTREAT